CPLHLDPVPLHPKGDPERLDVVLAVEVPEPVGSKLSFHLDSCVVGNHDIETIVAPEGMVTMRGFPSSAIVFIKRCPGILTINKRESVSRVINISFASRPFVIDTSEVGVEAMVRRHCVNI